MMFNIKTIAATAVVSLLAATPSIAQSVSTSATSTAATAADTAGIEVFSDTTGVDTAIAIVPPAMQVNIDGGGISDAFELFAHAIGDMLLPVTVLVMLFFALPVLILALAVYLIYRNNRQNAKLKAMLANNNQAATAPTPTPQPAAERPLWSRGVMNAAIGLGLVGLFWAIDWALFMGLSCLLMCYGAGQMVVAKTSGKADRQSQSEQNGRQDDSEADARQ